MKRFAVYSIATGQIVQISQAWDVGPVEAALTEGLGVAEVPVEVNDLSHYLDGNAQPVVIPAAPATGYAFDWELKTWFDARSPADIQADMLKAIQGRLDSFARTRNYDGILSACTYATDTNPTFAAEGQYCVEARGATWQAAYDILAEVQGGTRSLPTSLADIEGDLPVLEWPGP